MTWREHCWRLQLFAAIVWRPWSTGDRLGVALAWSVATGITDGLQGATRFAGMDCTRSRNEGRVSR